MFAKAPPAHDQPPFERDRGHKLIAKITPGRVVEHDIDSGEPFEIAISTTPMIEVIPAERAPASEEPK